MCCAVTILVAVNFPRIFRHFQQHKQKVTEKEKREAILQKVVSQTQTQVGGKGRGKGGGSRGNKRKELYSLLLSHIDALVVLVSTACTVSGPTREGGGDGSGDDGGLAWGEVGEDDEIAEEQLEDFCLSIKEQVGVMYLHSFLHLQHHHHATARSMMIIM
jgi:hypothetical protein